MVVLSFLLPLFIFLAPLKGNLSENQIISSQILGYDLTYRVYTPAGYDKLDKLPVIYLTDGQWYISEGSMPQIMDKLIKEKAIRPVIAVFVDNRDPETGENKRNAQFGYSEYMKFYQQELVPQIDETYHTSSNQADRAIMGLSLGGLNATYFGAKASSTFHMLGIQSPALRSDPGIYDLYLKQDKLPLKIFLSTGTHNDTETHARRLKRTLDARGYDFEYVEVPQGHDWSNWKPLIDDCLIYFFGPSAS